MAKDLPIQSLPDWASLRSDLQDSLLRGDIDSVTTFHHAFDGSEEDANRFAEELGGSGEEDGAVLLALWEQASAVSASRVRFVSRFASSDAAVHVMQQKRIQERKRLRLDVDEGVGVRQSEALRIDAKTGPVKWPSKLRRKLASADGINARSQAEASERARWIGALHTFIRQAQLLIMDSASASAQPSAAWAGIAQGLRARTLRRRVKDWQKAARYFVMTTGASWPSDVGAFLGYLQVLSDGEVAPSTFSSAIIACKFMERAGGILERDSIASHPLVQTRLKEYVVSADRPTRATKKAPPTTLSVIAAMVLAVVDSSRPTFERMYSWYRCVMVWSSMRFDDHKGALA